MVDYEVGKVNVRDSNNYEHLRDVMKQVYDAVSSKVEVKAFAKQVGVSEKYMTQFLSGDSMKVTKGQATKMVAYLNKRTVKSNAEKFAQPYAAGDGVLEEVADTVKESAVVLAGALEQILGTEAQVKKKVTAIETTVADYGDVKSNADSAKKTADANAKTLKKTATTQYVDDKVAEVANQGMKPSPRAFKLLAEARQTLDRCKDKLKKAKDADKKDTGKKK
jgi:hypothetical protein